MKRDELKAMSLTDEQIDKIMEMNGADINREKSGIEDYKKQIADRDDTIKSITTERDGFKSQLDGFKDYDAVIKERDELKARESDRLLADRFSAVIGQNKVKNQFTRDGLFNLFKEKIAQPEMKDQRDEDIFKGIIDGHEAEYFDSKVQITMPHVETPRATGGKENPTEVFGVKIIRG